MHRRQLIKFLGAGSIVTAISNSLTSSALASSPKNVNWGYIGAQNPEHWGEISSDFQLCKNGQQQTPIDLQGAFITEAEALKINYQPTPLKILNNGHTIQVNYQPGSFIVFKGETFELLQFHFHHPSEHFINGQAYDLEIHLVHKSSAGKLAVIGIVAQTGTLNSALQPIWNVLPLGEKAEQTIKNVTVNAAEFLPNTRQFYEYLGSLTTPPCSEGVLWFVMAQPIQLASSQIEKFAAIFPLNARPIQPKGDRTIAQSTQ